MIRRIKDLVPLRLRVRIMGFLKSRKNRKKSRITTKYKAPLDDSTCILNGQIAYNEYGGYFVPMTDSKAAEEGSVVYEILNGEAYEPDTISFMMNNCKEGDVIHAGTFFGDFLPGLSNALSDESILWAFEPDNYTFRCAQITILMNNLKNVELINVGLGPAETKAKLLTQLKTGKTLGGSSKIVTNESEGQTKEIKLVRIDDIIPNDRLISILQLDVEGFEKEAISGALKTIQRCKPILIIEDNNELINSDWFAQNILNIGYRHKGKIHNNHLLTATGLNEETE